MNLAVIGTGYIGLVGAAVFADWGNNVVGIDIDEKKINKIKSGVMPIYEPGLSELVLKNISEKRLSFTTSLAEGIKDAEIVFICVGTPQADDGAANLSAVWAVAREIGKNLDSYKVIVVKSTVPVGTNERVKEIITANLKKSVEFDVVSNPEFLREGTSIEDMQNTDRTVLGFETPNVVAVGVMKKLYAHLEAPIVECDLRSAELIKYASNAFLATKISFVNEIAQLCERAGADVATVSKGMGLDKRIGPKFLNPGVGYGGSCFSGDTLVYVKNSPDLKNIEITEVVQKSNEGKKVNTLGFDLTTRRAKIAAVSIITKRDYLGDMVLVKARMGRQAEVTADHPMLVFEKGEFVVKLAKELVKGDLLPFSSKLPILELLEEQINLVDIISKNDYLVSKTIMEPLAGYNVFSKLYSEIKPYATKHLKYANDIKRYNKLPLRAYLDLPTELKLKIDLDKIRLFTAIAKVPVFVKLDSLFLRYLGYFLAEGCIAIDHSKKGVARHRILITFHEVEKEYIQDVRDFYDGLGIKYFVRNDKNNHNVSLVVSSKIWAFLLKDYLNLGTNSYTKRFPKFVFRLNDELKMEILRGLFSGDGSLSTSFKKYAFIEFATVSRSLANDVILLLQSLGIVGSIVDRVMSKSKVRAYIIRISGKVQIELLKDILGLEIQTKINSMLKNVKYINPIGYKHLENFNLLPVVSAQTYRYNGPVYSLETSESTVVVNSGLIVHNCFPKDVSALYKTSTDRAYDFKLLRGVIEVNELQRDYYINKITTYFGHNLSGKTLACLGMAFKSNTDDVRESISIKIIRQIRGMGAKIRVFDPQAMETGAAELGDDNITYCKDEYDAVKGADALCILTEWEQFRALDLEKIKVQLKGKVLFDGRNLLDKDAVQDAGFTYFAIGRYTNALVEKEDSRVGKSYAILGNGNGHH